MKTLYEYINEKRIYEEYETFSVKDLKVSYKCFPNNEYTEFYVPEAYNEDNLMVYINDMFLNELPAGDKFAKDNFGEKNAQAIYDVFFTLERYEKYTSSTGNFINWDNSKDTNFNPDKDKFCFIKVKNLKYNISFEEFEIKDVDSSTINNTLITIFKAFNANETNKYPLKITLDDKNISYKE